MRTILILVVVWFAQAATSAANPEVGPNILVSRESALPKVELMLAVNPKNPRNLVGTAIAATPSSDVCTIYTSFDGGYSWKSVMPPGLPESGSGDPQVIFDAKGTAYFSALGLVANEAGRQSFSAVLYRSRDGGLSWEKVATFGSGTGPDHDMIVADKSGRVFISLVYRAEGQSNIGIYRLDSGGSRVVGPLRAAAGTGSGMFTWNPVAFSDGTLFVPFQIFKRSIGTSASIQILAATSHDAGATFSPPEPIGFVTPDGRNPVTSSGNVVFATDAESTRFRDRLYMLWNDASAAGGYRLRLAYSSDMGKTWSATHDVDARPAAHANAFRPAMAVNDAGVLGISWLDTRNSASGRTYREYFTASLDGGATFLEPVAVSSIESSLDASANFALRPTIDSPRTAENGDLEFSFNTILGRFPDGGDYMGLAADTDGAFHPFWADARTGTFQAWTATVWVGSLSRRGQQETEEELTKRVRPIFDPATYDPQTGVATIPVRLQNISDALVCKPLIVTIKGTTQPAPRVLNADNHKDWNGAYYDYSDAFRDLTCLARGEITEAVSWQVRPLDSAKTFVKIRVAVTHEAEK